MKILNGLLVINLFFLTACQSLKTSSFDSYSFERTMEIKQKTSRIISNYGFVYESQKDSISSLLFEIEDLIVYEKNKKDNELTLAMWEKIMAEKNHLLGGYFSLWRRKTVVSENFAKEAKQQIEEAIDLVLLYETNKDLKVKRKVLAFISN